MSMSKPSSEWTRDELENVVAFYERAIEKVLHANWQELVAEDEFRDVFRALSPLLIDPRPLTDETLERLREKVRHLLPPEVENP